LHGALSNLRKVINDIHASPSFLLINRETIQFNPASNHWLDVATFLSVPVDTSTDINPMEHFKKAIALYHGPFLNGFSLGNSAPFEEWLVLKREGINRHLMAFLCSLADHHEQDGDYELAQIPARRMVELEPWNEEAHRRLMRVLALGGQRSQALAQYNICQTAIAKELDVEPSRETNALYDAIRKGKLAAFPIFPSTQTTGMRTALVEAEKIFIRRPPGRAGQIREFSQENTG
jgi:DNA-binding SARP family transcriptional activator